MDLPTITTQISTLPTQRPLITDDTDTIDARCPVCGRTFEDCTCTGVAPRPTAVRMFDDGSDACPLCGYWTCRCGSLAHIPLYDATTASTWVPPVDVALDLAREALAKHADTNIHDDNAMRGTAITLECLLRHLVAALDKEAGR